MMTKKELVDLLAQYPDDMPIFVEDCINYYFPSPIVNIEEVNMGEDIDTGLMWYSQKEVPHEETVKALMLTDRCTKTIIKTGKETFAFERKEKE